MYRTSRRNPSRRSRRGIAITELAFCLPVILLLSVATVEVCSALFMKETLTIACYEGARVGVKRRSTHTDTVNAVNAVLTQRGIINATVTVTPSDFSTLRALDPVTVAVTAPINGNGAYVNNFFLGRTNGARVVMVREFDD